MATVAVRSIPASWLAALLPGGRLVTTIADTMCIFTARKTDDGGAWGMVEYDRAGIMSARTSLDPAATPQPGPPVAPEEGDGEVSVGRYPVIDVTSASELRSMLAITAPGIQHGYREGTRGRRSAWMSHADGSWATAIGRAGEPATVHQGGPRRLWDLLDGIRDRWLREGHLPLYGAEVRIDPDGTTHLRRGDWTATIT